ncbi:MAG TPA: hypothetical protein VFV80_04635 [Geminicoccaceae bacterium]|nr:hypothetical protein [Geminicoccaceae bacterium]
MVAVRNLLSTLNSLAQAGLPRFAERAGAATPRPAATTDEASEPWFEGPYVEGGVEPPLDELLGDPVIHLMMRADQLEPEQVRRLLTSRQGQSDP